MLTALDAPESALDEHERRFVANIRKHGWIRTSVFGEEGNPAFAYTTGFWVTAQAPELVIFSMKDELAHDVFWDMFRTSKSGLTYPIARRTNDVFANLPAYLFPVAKRHYREHLGWNRWFYAGDDFPCLQLVWSDRDGVFPWEAGFDETFRQDQPDLTESGWSASLAD